MKVYIICFDGETIAYPTAFLDKAQAEERLRIMQDEMDKVEGKSYSQWYSVEELEMERPVKLSTEMLDGQTEPTEPMTLEEIYDL
jgi:hypothetical protein